MSAHTSAGPAPARPASRTEVDDTERGSGWVSFAGVMLAILGTMNVVYGIAAIDEANVYVGDTQYVFGDLNMWGWFLLFVGVTQFAVAFGIWSRAQWARWVGVLVAGGNAILQLLFLPSFPLLSLALFALDVLVIYALVQYGGRPRTA
jgi:hypothetical protein